MSDTPVYHIRTEPAGFVVERDGCPPVRVERQATGLAVVGDGRAALFGFFDFHRITRAAAGVLTRDWRPRPGRKPFPGLRSWVIAQVARGLSRPIHPAWRALVAGADPRVVAVHRAVYAATRDSAPLAMVPALYQCEYLVRDLLQYRAACVALAHADALCRRALEPRLHRSAEMGRLMQLGWQLGAHVDVTVRVPDALPPHAMLHLLQDWRGLFAPGGETYGALDRTLMRLPGGVPSHLLGNLAEVRLPRPIVARAELLLVLLYAGQADRRHESVILHAGAADIGRALRRLGEHLREPLSTRQTRSLAQIVAVLEDFPERHGGNLPGLIGKVIEWRQRHPQALGAALAGPFAPATRCALPPVPLPDLPGVRFLATVGEILEEGVRMQHCAGAYAARAVGGESFLFHADYAGESATVEVSPAGRVLQAKGPHNRKNRATRWAARLLGRWGATFPSDAADDDGTEIPF